MDREFLADYEAKDQEEYERIESSYANVVNSAPIINAYRKRFKRLNDPVARTATGQSIWPQIPICGTLVVGLSPYSAERFSAYHGFSASDIDRLVDFAKDTGRIAFILEEEATEYASLDFLDTVFTELKPPRSWLLYSRPEGILSSEIEQATTEFDTLARVRLYQYIQQIASNPETIRIFGPNADFMSVLSSYQRVFVVLKLLGFQRLLDNVSDAMVQDGRQACDLLAILGELVVNPMADPLHAIANISREQIEEWRGTQAIKTDERITLSARSRTNVCEIGKFLISKLAPYPESFEACRAMCDKFEIHDLVKTVNSLEEAVEAQDHSKISLSSRNLSDILEKTWQDASSVATKAAYARGGLTLAIAILGMAAGALIETAGTTGVVGGGLMAGLGYNALEWYLDIKTDAISEKAARRASRSYLVNIFDFRRKYNLDSK